MRATLLLTATVASATVLCWCTVMRPQQPIGLVVVTMDTVRADRLSIYGAMDASMPHLERLAREGIVFERATSVAPLTLPAHCSLFTGLFPPSHGVRDNADRPLSADSLTLAEILRDEGFRTGAFVASIVLGRDRGLAQGFEYYGDVPAGQFRTGRAAASQRRADAVMTDAIDWLSGLQPDERFFLWAHLYDAHRPYDPPEPYRSRHPDPYTGEIAFADSQLGHLLEALERKRLMDRTIIVVVGDHGESLGEHGERDHGIFVYESVLHVPFIIRAPAILARRVSDVVRQVDMLPTLLDLLKVPGRQVDGISLVRLMHDVRANVELEAYSESMYPLRLGWSSLTAVRDGRFKFIDAPRPELYDLEEDPFEQRNLYADRQALAEALQQRVERHSAVRRPADGATVPDDVRERLRALGYVSGRALVKRDREGLPDPKDCISLHPQVQDERGIGSMELARCR